MATDFQRFEFYDPKGNLLLQGTNNELAQCLKLSIDKRLIEVLSHLCIDRKGKSGKGVLRQANELGFLSVKGNAPGFYTLLPNGTLLQEIVEAFNRQHIESLKAERIDFPAVYEQSDSALKTLTQTYEADGRIFRLHSSKELRLSYAADPGLFSWLSGKKINEEDLPYCIYSPLTGFRKWKSGELSPMYKFNAYHIPDFHQLIPPEKGVEHYMRCAELSSDGARFWFKEDWIHVLETDEGSLHTFREIAPQLARIVKQYTLFRISSEKPRYFSLKSGFMINAGFCAMMLYNLQLDNENGQRFDIRLPNARFLHIIHGTLAAGWPKLLPIIIGRGLYGVSPMVLPIELSPVQIRILCILPDHAAKANNLKIELEKLGLRVEMDARKTRLSDKLRQLRIDWIEHYIVFGDLENQNLNNVRIESWVTNQNSTGITQFLENRPQLERCRLLNLRIPRLLRFINE